MNHSLHDIVDRLARGAHSGEIRKTLGTSIPILERLVRDHPKIEIEYVMEIVRRHVRLALDWPNREARTAWKRLLVALDDLERAYWATGIQETEPSRFPQLRKELEIVRQVCDLPHLPDPKEPDEGGRPGVFWSNLLAFMLKEHFQEATGTSHWRDIAALLAAGPPIPNTLMDEEHVRQRLGVSAREDAEPVLGRPSLSFIAHGLRHRYLKEGAIIF